jgi:phage head maturation protease
LLKKTAENKSRGRKLIKLVLAGMTDGFKFSLRGQRDAGRATDIIEISN